MRKTVLAQALAAGLTLGACGGLAAAAETPKAPAADAPAPAQKGTVEQRLERLERLLDSQALVDMLSRLDALQSDLPQLRGQAEEQSHALEELKQRQRDLYLDIDRRLSRLEREGPGTASGATAPETNNTPAEGGAPDQTASGVAAQAPTGTAAGAGAAPAQPSQGAAADNRSPAATPVASAESVAQERQAYQKAFDLLRQLRYQPAIAAFQGFLKQYPDGRYAHIAQYWLGEANYAQRNFKAAIASYQQLLQRYPRSPKVAESMLKIGYSYYELGQKDEAKQTLSELVRAHPGSTEAGQAQKLLETIKREKG
jgi:tol-pal system protein YbgF